MPAQKTTASERKKNAFCPPYKIFQPKFSTYAQLQFFKTDILKALTVS